MNLHYLYLAVSFLIDIIIGDPVYPFHPVRLIGNWAFFIESLFDKIHRRTIVSGIIFWVFVCIPVMCLIFFIFYFLEMNNLILPQLFIHIFLTYSGFAFRDMVSHTRPVYKSLKNDDLNSARINLQKIVGRDTLPLKKDEIVRGCIESISESFVDSFFSPIFFYSLGFFLALFWKGNHFLLPVLFLWLYRISNTLDSMVGYKNEKYVNFGKFSAMFDDLLNFIPARLSFLIIIPSALLTRMDYREASRTFFRDRLKSGSPNAGHSMSLFAGALSIRLGGGAYYGGIFLPKPWIGPHKDRCDIQKIRMAEKLFIASGLFAVIILSFLYFIFSPR